MHLGIKNMFENLLNNVTSAILILNLSVLLTLANRHISNYDPTSNIFKLSPKSINYYPRLTNGVDKFSPRVSKSNMAFIQLTHMRIVKCSSRKFFFFKFAMLATWNKKYGLWSAKFFFRTYIT